MRELKVRAWDKRTNTMSPPKSLEDLCIMKDALSDLAIMEGDIEFLQYTGRKDKNGTEIYEGDIVETSRGGTPQRLPEVVEWGDTGWLPWEFEAGDSYYRLDSVKVIGNLHQNHELLEKKK